MCAQRKLRSAYWSAFSNPQDDLSLRWAQIESCRKCSSPVHMYIIWSCVVVKSFFSRFTDQFNYLMLLYGGGGAPGSGKEGGGG